LEFQLRLVEAMKLYRITQYLSHYSPLTLQQLWQTLKLNEYTRTFSIR